MDRSICTSPTDGGGCVAAESVTCPTSEVHCVRNAVGHGVEGANLGNARHMEKENVVSWD